MSWDKAGNPDSGCDCTCTPPVVTITICARTCFDGLFFRPAIDAYDLTLTDADGAVVGTCTIGPCAERDGNGADPCDLCCSFGGLVAGTYTLSGLPSGDHAIVVGLTGSHSYTVPLEEVGAGQYCCIDQVFTVQDLHLTDGCGGTCTLFQQYTSYPSTPKCQWLGSYTGGNCDGCTVDATYTLTYAGSGLYNLDAVVGSDHVGCGRIGDVGRISTTHAGFPILLDFDDASRSSSPHGHWGPGNSAILALIFPVGVTP